MSLLQHAIPSSFAIVIMMKFSHSALLDKLASCHNILLAGAGGGFDIFSGLPLYFYLRSQGKNVQLANLSFSDLSRARGYQLSEAALIINASAGGAPQYFPEKYLCEWFRHQGEQVEICCFHRVGVQPLVQAYQALCAHWSIDAVVLVDGGTDSLMRGDEYDLATPQEDIASIAAVHALSLEHRYLACIGFGIDSFHGINHYQFLEAVAALGCTGDFLGLLPVLKEMPEAQKMREAYEFVQARMPQRPSIVTTSILSAIQGEYGDYHATHFTQGSTLWINPLMNVYWAFNLAAVAERCLYLPEVMHTQSYYELTLAIDSFREQCEDIKPWQAIPV